MNGQTPSIGRVVHYVAYGTPGGEYRAGAHRAAVVTDVTPTGASDGTLTVREIQQREMSVSICILNPTGMFFAQNVPYDEHGMQPGSWHWPERA